MMAYNLTRTNVQKPTLKPRILLIEDDQQRIELFRSWLQGTDFVLIAASSGGRAAGILRKGFTEGLYGLCLDHDLDQQPVTDTDLSISGSTLIKAITHSIPRNVPILIHSMNMNAPVTMERNLKGVGYSVTRIRMAALTRELFHEWLEEVADCWEDMNS